MNLGRHTSSPAHGIYYYRLASFDEDFAALVLPSIDLEAPFGITHILPRRRQAKAGCSAVIGFEKVLVGELLVQFA